MLSCVQSRASSLLSLASRAMNKLHLPHAWLSLKGAEELNILHTLQKIGEGESVGKGVESATLTVSSAGLSKRDSEG